MIRRSRLTSDEAIQIAASEAIKLNVSWSKHVKAKSLLFTGNWKVTVLFSVGIPQSAHEGADYVDGKSHGDCAVL